MHINSLKTGPWSLVGNLLLTAALALTCIPAGAQVDLPVDTAAAEEELVPELPQSTITGAQVLARAANFLASQDSFFVDMICTNTLSLSGLERVNVANSRVWLRRPDRLVWTTQGDSGSSAVAYDGSECTFYLPSLSRYTVKAAQGAPESEVASMAAPMGLITSGFLSPMETTETVAAAAVSPPTLLPASPAFGVACHRLRVPVHNGNSQVWVAAGTMPLPIRIITTRDLPSADGSEMNAQSVTEVSFRWRVGVKMPDEIFHLKLPPTAMRVDELGGPNLAASRSKTNPPPVRKSGRETVISDVKKNGRLPEPPESLRNAQAELMGDKPPTRPSPSPTPRMVASNQSYKPQTAAAPPPPSSAQLAPAVKLPLLSGGQLNLRSLRGKKAVVLDFWATWCGPCRQAMPVVGEVAATYSRRGVDFFAVNMDEDKSTVQDFVRQNGLRIPVAMDAGGRAASAFGVSGIPHLVVIGRDGSVKGVHTGADGSLKQQLMRDLETALQ